ncbi:ras-related and estrogen-regulated growth inhibitor [Oratosquilla oratoria]|uniref:ras-related and estrogen-regulated growth inhibitor n=1 Tax=Oratosquilla oratoria TaxID=337810 RepID=UPI003F75E2EF
MRPTDAWARWHHDSSAVVTSPKASKLGLSKIGLGKPKPIRVMVLGQSGVGKSALVVRFITRRYIGEYDPTLERIYPCTVVVRGNLVSFEILDSAGQSQESDSVRLECNIRWADVFVLMYSVADKCSFDDCNRLKFLINYNKRKRRISAPSSKDATGEVPVILVGNKKDQIGDRMVATREGFKRSHDIGCRAFHEISVRESIEEVQNVFWDVVQFWRDVVKAPKLRRASSDLHAIEIQQQQSTPPPSPGRSTTSVPGSPAAPRAMTPRGARRMSIRSRTHPV